MSNKTGFYAYCPDCGALLRSLQRLQNHQASRCNHRIWPRKKGQTTKADSRQ